MRSREEVLRELRQCAASWDPDVKLIGNVSAAEIVALCDGELEAQAEDAAWDDTFARNADTLDALAKEAVEAHERGETLPMPCEAPRGEAVALHWSVIRFTLNEAVRIATDKHGYEAESAMLDELASKLDDNIREHSHPLVAAVVSEAMVEALSQYANSINWMTHTDQDDDNFRRVWIGSGDGRDIARAALTAARGGA